MAVLRRWLCNKQLCSAYGFPGKWLCWGYGFQCCVWQRRFVPLLLLHPSPKLAVSVDGAKLCPRVDISPSPFPFCFLHFTFPTSSAPWCHLWCSWCPGMAGDYQAGAGSHSREQTIFCTCGWMCEAWVILFAFGSNFLGLGIVKQLKGLTLTTWFPLAKPL